MTSCTSALDGVAAEFAMWATVTVELTDRKTMQMPSRYLSSVLPRACVRLVLAGLVFSAVFGVRPGPAVAAERKMACVLDAKTNGSVTPEELLVLENAVNNALKEQQFDLASKGERDTIIQGEGIQGCFKEECQERIGRLLGAHAVMVYSLKVWRSTSGAAWTLGATYYNVEVGAIGAKATSECPSCTVAQAATALSDLVKKAIFDDAAKPRGQVVITSDPTNASVFIDGVELGVTPYKRTVFAGKHELTLRRTGHRSKNQSLNVTEGQLTNLSIKLDVGQDPVQVKYVAEHRPRPKWRIALGGALIGVGALGMLYGITGLALNGQCVDSVPMGTACLQKYTSLPMGAALTGVGVAAAAVGAVLIALPGPRNTLPSTGAGAGGAAPASSAPQASLLFGGVGSGVGLHVQGSY
ncbi:MAG: PEGA domain-containing protein [Myxococcales bacterium]|nr:PEGA domain-containing protein [Myxococcales bacterium]